jgi:RNA polymerase sigma factor (sigma-70 family)
MGAKMKDYIKIPTSVKELNEIYSINLKTFLQNNSIDGNRISLAFLRDLYKMDKNHFVQVVDELSLRGFCFHTVKSNNILPNHCLEPSPYLLVEENENRYKDIDLNRLGISGFIQRFNVNSDLFFNKIPLEGFKVINANISIDELEEELTNTGFTIVNPQSLQATNEENSTYVTDKNSLDSETEVFLKEKHLDQFFKENKFASFRNFCAQKGIYSVLEISDDHIYEYSQLRGVGKGKLQAVMERLQKVKTLRYNELIAAYPENTVVIEFKNKYTGEIEIPLLFQENKYYLFREFCRENDIKTVGQIQQTHIEVFSTQSGIGKKKSQDVLDVLEQYVQSIEKHIPTHFESGEIFKYVQHSKVTTLLKAYNYPTNIFSSMRIADIEGKTIEELEDIFEGRRLIDLSNDLKSQKSPKTIVREALSLVGDREREILKFRLDEKKTLEVIAQNYGITRERVRQIEIKALRTIIHHLETNNFTFIVKLLSLSETLVSSNELLSLIGQENTFLLGVLKHKDSSFTYFAELDVYFFNMEENYNLAVIQESINELPDTFYLYEYETILQETLEKIGVENPTLTMLESLLQNYGFNKYGELYSRYKLYIHDILEQLFRMYITAPLRIDNQGVEILQKLAERHLDYQLERNVRAIDARIRGTENVILVDRATFQWFDNEKFDNGIINKIDVYLQQRFKKIDVINIEEIFIAFEAELEELNIQNKLHLYSIVKYYLDEKYSIGQGNTLNIFKNEGNRLNIEESMINSMKNLGGCCTKSQLQEILRWPLYKIDLAISSSYKIVPWGLNQVILFDAIKLSEEQKIKLIKLAERCLKDGYTTTPILYKELMFDRSLSSLISENGIDDLGKLAGIIKILIPSLRGHINFLYVESCKFTCFEDVIIHTFGDETTRGDIREFALEYGYKDIMASNLLKKMLEQEIYIEIDMDGLYPSEKLNIPIDVINQLKEFVNEATKNNQYISLSNLKGYKRKLPPIDFRWNPYLMKSVLVKHGYRQINKIYNDYRYDKVILVKEESNIQTFEELVHFILKEEYEGNMHEVPVYDFLVEKGIFRKQEYDHKKILPYEIRSYDNLINVDNLGFITLR